MATTEKKTDTTPFGGGMKEGPKNSSDVMEKAFIKILCTFVELKF
jgi:hypothetical protein